MLSWQKPQNTFTHNNNFSHPRSSFLLYLLPFCTCTQRELKNVKSQHIFIDNECSETMRQNNHVSNKSTSHLTTENIFTLDRAPQYLLLISIFLWVTSYFTIHNENKNHIAENYYENYLDVRFESSFNFRYCFMIFWILCCIY